MNLTTIPELVALLQRDNSMPLPKGWQRLNPLRWLRVYLWRRHLSQAAAALYEVLEDHDETDDAARAILLAFCRRWKGFCGVESIPHPSDGYTEFNGVEYANTGETYDSTLYWDAGGQEWHVGNWGDWVESVQDDALDEAFDNWIAKDFEGAVKRKLNLYEIWETGDEWRELFNACCQKANSYPCVENSGHGFFAEIDTIAAVATIDLLDRYGVHYETMEEEEESETYDVAAVEDN